MRIRIVAIGLVVLLAALSPGFAAGRVAQIAVLEFRGPEESWIGRGIALLVERELLSRDGVVVLDRAHLAEVLREGGLAASGLLSARARRSLSVGAIDFAVVGTWTHGEAGAIRVSALVLDTETGKTIASASETTPVAELSAAAGRITARLAQGLADRAPGIAAPPRFVLPPVPADELTALTLSADSEERGDYPSAYLQLRKGLHGRPDSAALRLALGRLLLRMGEPWHAALALREAVARGHPAVASKGLSLLARVFEHDLARPDLAARAYRELIRRFPHVGDVERSRFREIELLDRAGRHADAYQRLLQHRDRLLARLINLDETTRWFGYPYQRISGEVNAFEDRLAQRWVELGDAERSGLPRPRTVHLVSEDGLTLSIGPGDLGVGQSAGDRTFHLVAGPGQTIVSATIEAETGPTENIPAPTTPREQIGVRATSGYQVLRFGADMPPRGTETKTLVFDDAKRHQRLHIDTRFRWRKLYRMKVTVRLGGPEEKGEKTTRWPPPEGTERIVSGAAGEVSWLDARADGEDLVIVFCDVVSWLGPGTGSYPWPIGKDADLYLCRYRAGGKTETARLPLSSEREDLFPTIARSPDGTWRMLWLSNRRTGFLFEAFTATSRDLRHWTWPRPVDLGIEAKPGGVGRKIMWANLGATLPISAPRLHCDRNGLWRLLCSAFVGPGKNGTLLLTSEDGETFGEPVQLTEGRCGNALLFDAPGGGVEAIWLEREGEYEPGRQEIVHVLHRFRIRGGRVAHEAHIPLGNSMPRNPSYPCPRPWIGPEGEIYAGWTRRREPGPGETDHTFRPMLFRLYRIDRDNRVEVCEQEVPVIGGQGAVTVATTAGIHLLRPWGRWHLMRCVEGGIDHLLADLPGRATPEPRHEPVKLPPGKRDPDAPITAVVLPVEAEDAALGEVATALLMEALAGGKQIRLVTRDRVDELLGEMTADERRGGARIGRLAGADLVFSGFVGVQGEEATVVVREFDVATTKVRSQRSWTGRKSILLPMLASLAAETGNPWYDIERGVNRFAEDAEARMHFVSSVSDAISGISRRAAGGFFEALRLGLDYPPTRYWLARSLLDLGEKAGAELEYGRYLEESPKGAFAAEARAGRERVAGSLPSGAKWIPTAAPDAGETDLLRRIYRGRSMTDRVAALREFAAGPGREHLDTLLEIFDLEADEWFRFQVLSAIRDLDPRLMLRAAAREIRSGASLENEMGNFLKGVDARPWIGRFLLECLGPVQSPETGELWEGACLLPAWPLGTGKQAIADAAAEALESGDPDRIHRALTVLDRTRNRASFEKVAGVFDDLELPEETRKLAAASLVRTDRKRAWRHFEPRLLAGENEKMIAEAIRFIPVDMSAERLRELLLDPKTEGWYGLLLEKAKRSLPDRVAGIAAEMLYSKSEVVRRRGVQLIDRPALDASPGVHTALIRISRSDPDPELRRLALGRRCWLATVEEAEALLPEIAELEPEWRRGSALRSLSWALRFRPEPASADGIAEWRRWLEFFRTQRAESGPWIEELEDPREPTEERAREIFEALGASRDPEAVRAIGTWLYRYRFKPEDEPTPATRRLARAATNRILTALGFPEHLLPGEGVSLTTWVQGNDPGTFRPWRR